MSFRLATLAATVTLLVACHGGGNHPNDLAGTDGGVFDQGPPNSGLKFAVQPSNVRTGAAITAAVQVSVVDGSGNVITSATDSITLALGTNTAGATLGVAPPPAPRSTTTACSRSRHRCSSRPRRA
jgi:hypothetical protein